MGRGGGDYRSEEIEKEKKKNRWERGEKREEGEKKRMQGVCFEPLPC